NRAYAEQYGVQFELESRVSAALVRADSDRLMQVMTNLLSNAVKFSPRDGTVQVALTRGDGDGNGDAVRVSVTDHGPGIPEEFQPHVFEKFAQADSTDSRRLGGTGLGLSIAKALVER